MDRPKRSKTIQRIALALFFLGGFAILYPVSRMDHRFGEPRHYFPVDVIPKTVDGKVINDTIWHRIPEFSFIDQEGRIIDRSHIDGRIAVVDFFFTSCRTICPPMQRQMRNLIWELDDEYFEEVRFLSFTVDPEYDTPEVLKAYAKQMEADTSRWSFATGPKEEIYKLGVEGFFLTTQEDLEAEGGFLHSEKFVLVDKEGHIRGLYNGTDSDEVRDLEEDIKMLLGMERKAAKRKKKGL